MVFRGSSFTTKHCLGILKFASLDAPAMIAQLKASIANFKVPKHLFVVAELPRNAMGKVQKNLLREQHKGLFAA